MNKSKTYFLLGIIVTVLILGIAYAAIVNIDLTINGSATATAAEGSFDVQFTDTKFTGVGKADNLEIVETAKGLVANFGVSGLTKVGDTCTVEFTIENKSTDLVATLATKTLTNSEDEYFSVVPTYSRTTLDQVNGGTNTTATLTLTIKLLKLPVDVDEITTDIVAVITASPSNPVLAPEA